jgi:hypothetical protein
MRQLTQPSLASSIPGAIYPSLPLLPYAPTPVAMAPIMHVTPIPQPVSTPDPMQSPGSDSGQCSDYVQQLQSE